MGREIVVAIRRTGRDHVDLAAVPIPHGSSTSTERYPAGHVGHIANLSSDHS